MNLLKEDIQATLAIHFHCPELSPSATICLIEIAIDVSEQSFTCLCTDYDSLYAGCIIPTA